MVRLQRATAAMHGSLRGLLAYHESLECSSDTDRHQAAGLKASSRMQVRSCRQ
jgi:hypothetical protein